MDENKVISEEKLEEKAEEKTVKRKKKGHAGAFILGLVIFAFAVFGVYKAISWGIDKVNYLAANSAKTAEYEEFIEPFVVIDPSYFDDISGADAIDLLDAAISAIIYNSDKLNTYDVYEGEITGLLVPQEDVEASFISLFGTDVKLVHTDVANSFYGVMYSSANSAYVIPITSVDPTYTPKIYSVDKTGSSVVLTVGYISGSEWAQLENGQYTAPEPSKYVKITLREDGKAYHIGALQNTEAVEVVDPDKTVPATEPITEAVTFEVTSAETVTDESGSIIEVSNTESETEAEDVTEE